MRKILIAILAPVALFSCRGPKCLTEGTTIVVHDSTVIRDTIVTVKEVPFLTKGDSAKLKDTIKELPKDLKKEKEVKSGHTTAKYKIENQELTVECNTAPYEDTIRDLRVQLKAKESYSTRVETRTVIKEVKVPVTPNWVKILIGFVVGGVIAWVYSKGWLSVPINIIKKLLGK